MAVNLNPTNITDLRDTCRQYKGNLGAINVSGMTSFSNLFNLPEFQAWSNNDFNGIETWDLSGATTFSNMFFGCVNFNRNITLNNNKNLSSSGYIVCTSMFEGCTSLTTITSSISSSVYGRTNSMDRMFYGCTSLTSISGSIKLYTYGGNNSCTSMFEGCTSLNITETNVSLNTIGGSCKMDRMFYGCTSMVRFKIPQATCSTYEYMFYGCTSLTTSSLNYWSGYGSASAKYMFYGCSNLNSLDTSGYYLQYLRITDSSYMFYGCSNLNVDLSKLDMINNKNMESMFEGCTSFNKSISKWTIVSVNNFDRMFYGCNAFDQDLSSWTLKPSSTYVDMFTNCPIQEQHKPYPLNGKQLFQPTTREELKSFCDDLSNSLADVDTSLITDMSYLFENSTRTEADFFNLINWNFNNVTTIRGMFKGCNTVRFYYNNVYYLDYISFPNVEDASELFMDCTSNTFYFGTSYKKIDFPKLKDATSMYENNTSNYCYSYNFYTDNLEHMDNMFKNTKFNGSVFSTSSYRSYGCWNLPNLISMDGAFSNCSNWTSYNPYYFDASNVQLNSTIFENTTLNTQPWWILTTIPDDLTADIGFEYLIDMNPWIPTQYASTSFSLTCSDPDVTIKYKSKNIYSVLCNTEKTVRLNMTYSTYGKLGFNFTFTSLNVDYTTDVKSTFTKQVDLTNINPNITVTSIDFSNIQQGLTIQNNTGFIYNLTADNAGTYTADVLVNNIYSGVLTVNSTNLIDPFTLNINNGYTVTKNFNEIYSGYDVTSMTITSNDTNLSVIKDSDGIFTFKPLLGGTYTATIDLNNINTEVTINSRNSLSNLNYQYRATETKTIDLSDIFATDVASQILLTSNDINLEITKLTDTSYSLVALISGSFTANINLNNETSILTFQSSKLIDDETSNIKTNTLYSFDLNTLYPNSLIKTSDFRSNNPLLVINNLGNNDFNFVSTIEGSVSTVIDVNGEESNINFNISKLIQDETFIVNNRYTKVNFLTKFPNISATNITLTALNKNDKVIIEKKDKYNFLLTFLEKGSYRVSVNVDGVTSTYTFSVFFVRSDDKEIYQYPVDFIDNLIKPQLYDDKLYIYQYNQYGEIDWINKYFSYINDKMKKYLNFIYLWYVSKTNQDLSNLDMSFINDNSVYFYLNFIEKYFRGINKSFGNTGSIVFWDSANQWNDNTTKWDTVVKSSDLSINKFKSILRFINDINYKAFNIERFLQFCDEFVNCDITNESERIDCYVTDDSFTNPSSIILFVSKTDTNTNLLQTVIKSSYSYLFPMNEFVIRQG